MISSCQLTRRVIPRIAIALLLLLCVMFTAPNGDDVKLKGDNIVSEAGALRIALDQIEKVSFLEGKQSYEITAKFNNEKWFFRFVPLPRTPDLEMSVFVNKDGTSRISR